MCIPSAPTRLPESVTLQECNRNLNMACKRTFGRLRWSQGQVRVWHGCFNVGKLSPLIAFEWWLQFLFTTVFGCRSPGDLDTDNCFHSPSSHQEAPPVYKYLQIHVSHDCLKRQQILLDGQTSSRSHLCLLFFKPISEGWTRTALDNAKHAAAEVGSAFKSAGGS